MGTAEWIRNMLATAPPLEPSRAFTVAGLLYASEAAKVVVSG